MESGLKVKARRGRAEGDMQKTFGPTRASGT